MMEVMVLVHISMLYIKQVRGVGPKRNNPEFKNLLVTLAPTHL